MIATSQFTQEYFWYLIFGGLFLLISLERFFKTEAGRAKKDSTVIKIPVVGQLVSDVCVSRFARTLGTLLKSGVPMINSLSCQKRGQPHSF